MAWLLLRSGTKPSRLTYPCQQSAFSLATAAFGGPIVIAVLAGRTTLLRILRTPMGALSGGMLGMLLLFIGAVASLEPSSGVALQAPPADYHPQIFLVNDARGPTLDGFGGVDDLLTLMGNSGLKWHRSTQIRVTSGPDGLIGSDDVVLIKINGQWTQRGGTNTDVLRGVIRRIVEHPNGFTGEVVVADNTQNYSNLDRAENNAEDTSQSPQDVVDDFATEGWHVSTSLWDSFRGRSAGEYADGDPIDGYVVSAGRDPQTDILVSYPKFRSAFGTYISYKRGVWSPSAGTYEPDRLVVINIPVLKTHSIYGVTASVKNHMGVVTTALSTDSHYGVARGGLGSLLSEVRMPDLNILDCIWILARPGLGPSAAYTSATRCDKLVASRDPVALDIWAVKNVLSPQVIANGYTAEQYGFRLDPDDPTSIFRAYLDKSMSEMLAAGIDATNDYRAVALHTFRSADTIPTVSHWGLMVTALLLLTTGTLVLTRRSAIRL
jgi:uncharacterized protein (DUF362 family)